MGYRTRLAALYAALADYTECVVIAPDQDKSGASSSLTLDRPLHPQTLANGFISVNGTPTDCVHLGLNGLLERAPDMVVSGSIWAPTWAMTCCIPARWRRPSKGVSWRYFAGVLAGRARSTTCRRGLFRAQTGRGPRCWTCRRARC
jgi:hypothetical protein